MRPCGWRGRRWRQTWLSTGGHRAPHGHQIGYHNQGHRTGWGVTSFLSICSRCCVLSVDCRLGWQRPSLWGSYGLVGADVKVPWRYKHRMISDHHKGCKDNGTNGMCSDQAGFPQKVVSRGLPGDKAWQRRDAEKGKHAQGHRR